MPTRLEAIANFLNASTHPELASMYTHEMEVQVNVAQDNGQRVQGEYGGKQWLAWSDGVTTWKSFRVPYKANTEPEYTDKPITYDLAAHVEGIGMTGWNWVKRQSHWLAYDFDAITGHSDKHAKKLTAEELAQVKDALSKIPWVELRTSTSGKGLHMYVHLTDEARVDPNMRTANHHEHAALGRAILSTLCALCAYDFNTKVDVAGGNMWVWHRKMIGTNGLTVLKSATGQLQLKEIPQNWRDHLKVVRGARKKVGLDKTRALHDPDFDDAFENLTTQHSYIALDAEHKRLIDHLNTNGACWWWLSDNNMLVCHTYDLKTAHKDLGLKGIFNTVATGKEAGADINCYCCPLPKGAWVVRRYGKEFQETNSWIHEANSWTKCTYNRDVEFEVAMRINGGIELEKGGFQFETCKLAAPALKLLGHVFEVDPSMMGRTVIIKKHKDDGKIVIAIKGTKEDRAQDNPGYILEKMFWKKVATINVPVKSNIDNSVKYDGIVRHLITPDNTDAGWVIRSDTVWVEEPLTHVRAALSAMDYTGAECGDIIGDNIFKPWRLINLPFQPEYTGDRSWNRDAAQLKFIPSPDAGDYPTWMNVLEHCGKGLDLAIARNDWCKANGIVRGAEYLKCWIASLIKEPLQPLPYLFFYSEKQHTGKSTFHESLSLLFTRGVVNASQAIMSQGGFNGELEAAVLCTVEEIDLKSNKTAYGRIKEWVTAIQMMVHHKGMTPYMIPNTTHWCQFANSRDHCPVFPGDTRITMIRVEPFGPDEHVIARKELQRLLEKEAPDFLSSVLALELPGHSERLNIPVIETEDKRDAEDRNKSDIDTFFDLFLPEMPGHAEVMSEVFKKFQDWLPAGKRSDYNTYNFGKQLPPRVAKGRTTTNPNVHVGNVTFDPHAVPGEAYVVIDGFLRQSDWIKKQEAKGKL